MVWSGREREVSSGVEWEGWGRREVSSGVEWEGWGKEGSE